MAAATEFRDRYLSDPVLVRSRFYCQYCGVDLLSDLDTFITIVRDHLVPRRSGGLDALSNLIASCAACDRLKGCNHFADMETAQAAVAGMRLCRLATLNAVRAAVRQIGGVE